MFSVISDFTVELVKSMDVEAVIQIQVFPCIICVMLSILFSYSS